MGEKQEKSEDECRWSVSGICFSFLVSCISSRLQKFYPANRTVSLLTSGLSAFSSGECASISLIWHLTCNDVWIEIWTKNREVVSDGRTPYDLMSHEEVSFRLMWIIIHDWSSTGEEVCVEWWKAPKRKSFAASSSHESLVRTTSSSLNLTTNSWATHPHDRITSIEVEKELRRHVVKMESAERSAATEAQYDPYEQIDGWKERTNESINLDHLFAL